MMSFRKSLHSVTQHILVQSLGQSAFCLSAKLLVTWRSVQVLPGGARPATASLLGDRVCVVQQAVPPIAPEDPQAVLGAAHDAVAWA